MTDLGSRTVLVTGGANGIGRQYVRTLIEAGANLAILDIRGAENYASELGREYGAERVLACTCDISAEQQVVNAVHETIQHFGGIDVLVNNAGYLAPLRQRPATDWTAEIWETVLRVNILGTYLMCKHVAPCMIARKAGKIINVGSSTIYRGVPFLLPYVTSKGATVSMTRALARELGAHNVTVNTLAPGLVLSDTVVAADPDEAARANAVAVAGRSLKRDMYPDDLQGALLFLSSAASDFMTGQTLLVDGGAANI